MIPSQWRISVVRTSYSLLVGQKKNEDCFLLNILNVQIEQQKKIRNKNSNSVHTLSDRISGYSGQALEEVKIICYDRRIYVI